MAVKWSILTLLSVTLVATYFFFPTAPGKDPRSVLRRTAMVNESDGELSGKAGVLSASIPAPEMKGAQGGESESPAEDRARKLAVEIGFLREQLETASREKSATAARIKELEDRDGAGEVRRAESDEVREELRRLSEEYAALVTNYRNLQEENSSLTDRVQEFQSKSSTPMVNESDGELSGKAGVLSASIPASEMKGAQGGESESPAEDRAWKLAEEIGFLKEQLEKASREKSATAARVRELEDKEGAGEVRRAESDAVKEEMGRLSEKHTALVENYRHLQEENSRLAARLEELQSGLPDPETRVSDEKPQEVAVASLSGENDHPAGEVADLRHRIEPLEREIQALRQERDGLLAEKEETLSAKQDLSRQLDELGNSMNREREESTHRIASLEARLNRPLAPPETSPTRKDVRAGGVVPSDSQLAHEVVVEIQQALLHLGYSPGATDGVLGPRTRKAILAFQVDVGITTDEPVPGMHALLGRYEQVQSLQPDWVLLLRSDAFHSWLKRLPSVTAFRHRETLKAGSPQAVHKVLAEFKRENP